MIGLVAATRLRLGTEPQMSLRLTEIAGHLTYTADAVTAWYVLAPQVWAYRPDPDREAWLTTAADQLAGLGGHRLHLRRTACPYPDGQWSRAYAGNATPLPDVPGAPTWLERQIGALGHLEAAGYTDDRTYLGVSWARGGGVLGTLTATAGRLLPGRLTRAAGDRLTGRLGGQIDRCTAMLAGPGLAARPATADELALLVYRSVGLGLDVPDPPGRGDWGPQDVVAFTEQVDRYRTPYGSTLRLLNRVTGQERHVAVLTVGPMQPQHIPERHDPWLQLVDLQAGPVEISSRVDLLGPAAAAGRLQRRLLLIRANEREYAEHGLDAPLDLTRQAANALIVGDQLATGQPADAARAHGRHRIAVSDATRQDCLDRARELIELYQREARIRLVHTRNQAALAREFVPGEPVANTGYLRCMPAKLFAAAVPQAVAVVGDSRGDLIGETCGTGRRPVFLDLHLPMEVRERSGLAVFVSEPGGGKSTLLGALGYLAARRGVQVTLLDPSGPLARLCAMPELAPYARVLDLTGSQPGTLAPYPLIPTPRRADFTPDTDGQRGYEDALADARAERKMLVLDVCAMLLPAAVARRDDTAAALRDALRAVPAEESTTLEDVVDALRDLGTPTGTSAANLLDDVAEYPLARLLFGQPPAGVLADDTALTVITMAGLRLPDMSVPREDWTAEEALALPMLHTAHRLAVRRCYGGDMGRRKLVGLDEAHFMQGWPSGRSFLVRLARDSRKWNLAALVASQNPADILGLDVQNLVSTVFVGRIAEDSEIAAEALRLLRVPTGVGHEQTLAALSQVDTSTSARLGFREFVMRDVDGRVQKIRVDVSYVPELLTYLDTTPTGRLS